MLNLHLLECNLKGYDHITDLLLAKYWVITGCKYYACNNISKLHLNCTKIENWFSNLKKSVTDIYLGESVKAIGDYAFSDFCKISNIELPNTVNSIGKYAFSYHHSLKAMVWRLYKTLRRLVEKRSKIISTRRRKILTRSWLFSKGFRYKKRTILVYDS